MKKNNLKGKYGSAGSRDVYFARIKRILDFKKKNK